MPTAGGSGRRCPVFPLWVMAPGLDSTIHPLGWDGVSLSPPRDADSTTAQILLEHLPSCDTGQGHLHVPRANCMSPCGTGTLCPLHLNIPGVGARTPPCSQEGPRKPPPRHTQTPPHLQEPQCAASSIPSPDATSRGSPHLPPTPGMLLVCLQPLVLPREWGSASRGRQAGRCLPRSNSISSTSGVLGEVAGSRVFV